MRTTLTLDHDVAAKLKSEVRRTGRSFKQVVNDSVRAGLTQRERKPPRPFVVRARALSAHPGLNLDNVAELLEQLEGAGHR